MKNLFIITVRWAETPIHPPLIDAVLGMSGNWIRFTMDSWLLSTPQTSIEMRLLLLKHLRTGDSFLILPFQAGSADGWAPNWLWKWIRDEAGLGLEKYSQPPLPPPPPLPSS